MKNVSIQTDIKNKPKALWIIGLCAAGLLINFLGVQLVAKCNLPLYLDNIGSSLSAALGGNIPGIIVGFFTNLINGIGDGVTIYYGCLTVMIALASAYYAKKGFYTFRKPWRLLVPIITFTLIGGGLGSVITWALNDFAIGTGFSAALAQSIHTSGVGSEFLSQLFSDLLYDLLDKTITVLIVAAVFQVIPDKWKRRMRMTCWRQRPLTEISTQDAHNESRLSRGFTLRFKIILLIAVSMLAIGAAVIIISCSNYLSSSIEEQTKMGYGVVQAASEAVDADRVEEFLEKGESAEGYLGIEERLRSLADSSDNIAYVYVYKILEDGCHVVFDPDTNEETGADPGEIVEFDQAFMDVLPTLLAGGDIEPVISNETYGWLLTIYKPLYDSQGTCQCYVAVDINMDHIAMGGYQFLVRMISLFLGIFLLIIGVSIWLAEYNIILPINSMDVATGRFAYDSEEARTETVDRIRQLDIHTGDEIENLYHSVVKTTEDTVQYIEFTHAQNEALHKFQNGLILVLADMVESRDQNTGDHVRKTAAYTDIIMRQLKKEGIYTEQLTDEFMYDVFHSAPLHDVGKISVSDTILNKPGKLTDEEFEIIKTHTTAGAEVIGRAMHTVSGEGSNYLKEARNLACYHHEKWDGSGYPEGLKGEEIPLSARIMAVADVFDALVSVRSYKKGFSFEKAMGIIEEGAGSHFDPQVVKAFMDAGDEVRKVMEMQMDL